MNAAQQILSSHKALVVFLAKMLAIYAVWFVIYDLWLLPDGRLDATLSTFVASATGTVLSPFYSSVAVDARTVWVSSHAGVIVEDGCNGLSALSLFVGFVIAYPGDWARRALFIPIGLVAIVLTNIVRCAAILVVADLRPESVELVHAFHATFVFYLAVFGLWVLWANHGARPETTSRSVQLA